MGPPQGKAPPPPPTGSKKAPPPSGKAPPPPADGAVAPPLPAADANAPPAAAAKAPPPASASAQTAKAPPPVPASGGAAAAAAPAAATGGDSTAARGQRRPPGGAANVYNRLRDRPAAAAPAPGEPVEEPAKPATPPPAPPPPVGPKTVYTATASPRGHVIIVPPPFRTANIPSYPTGFTQRMITVNPTTPAPETATVAADRGRSTAPRAPPPPASPRTATAAASDEGEIVHRVMSRQLPPPRPASPDGASPHRFRRAQLTAAEASLVLASLSPPRAVSAHDRGHAYAREWRASSLGRATGGSPAPSAAGSPVVSGASPRYVAAEGRPFVSASAPLAGDAPAWQAASHRRDLARLRRSRSGSRSASGSVGSSRHASPAASPTRRYGDGGAPRVVTVPPRAGVYVYL